jgi:hypothetical protein
MTCPHETSHGLWWHDGLWFDWSWALRFGMKWEQMGASRCNACRAWLSLGPATPPPADEFQLAAHLQDTCVHFDGTDREEVFERYVDGFAG